MSKDALGGIHDDIRAALSYYNRGMIHKFFIKLKTIRFQVSKLKPDQKKFFKELEKKYVESKTTGMRNAICEMYCEKLIFYADKCGMYLPETERDDDVV